MTFYYGDDSKQVRAVSSLGEIVTHDSVHYAPGIFKTSVTVLADSRHRDKHRYVLPNKFEVAMPCVLHDVYSVELVSLMFPLKVDLADPYVLVVAPKLARDMHIMPNQTANEAFEGNRCNGVFHMVPVSKQFLLQGQVYVKWQRDIDGDRAVKRFYSSGCKLDKFEIALETFLPGPAGPNPQFTYPVDPNDVVVAVFEVVYFH